MYILIAKTRITISNQNNTYMYMYIVTIDLSYILCRYLHLLDFDYY